MRKYLRAAALSAVALAIPIGSAVLVTAPAVAATTFRPPAAMLRVFHDNVKSSNWSGYAVSGATFSDVVGTWKQPAAKCSGTTEYASFWVGIDGYSSQSVEQLGTDSDCNGSSPSYYGWYEMYPANSVDLGSKYKVSPGDVMTAEVKVSGSSFVLSMKDATAGWTFSITKTGSSSLKRSSAEWVIESPEICSATCKLAKLADYGKVAFTNCEAATTGSDAAISSFTGAKGPHRMTMTGTPKTVIRATTSKLSSNGKGFTNSWKHS